VAKNTKFYEIAKARGKEGRKQGGKARRKQTEGERARERGKQKTSTKEEMEGKREEGVVVERKMERYLNKNNTISPSRYAARTSI
jgi:hypothetical protein